MNNRKPQGGPSPFASWRKKPDLGSVDPYKNNSMRGSGSGRGYGLSRGGASAGTSNSDRNSTPNKNKRERGRGRDRGRGRGKDMRFSETIVTLDDDEDNFCQQAMGQFELANSDIGKAFEAGQDAKEIPGFERAAGEVWIYPTNRPVRDYQFNMVNTALFHNTLVCLPTGLGKTFIAAVVMFNFHRWYPDEIIVFMAPTRPLVTQQLDACHNIVGINPSATVELTGQTLPAKREALWREKRVFFLTPQVLQSDIIRDSCPAHKIRCVVIDEAHKALGNHSYAQVISAIAKVNKQFRVLALSATPGNDLAAIQQVFKNLLISRLELRCEDSSDILPYVHNRKVETRVVCLDPFLVSIQEQMKEMFQIYTGKLMKQKILPRNGSSFVAFQLLQARQRFRACPPPELPPHERSYAEVTFYVCISLARAIDLLSYHGLRSFYSFLHGLFMREKGSAVVASELKKQGVEEILTKIQEKLNISVENSSFNISSSGLFDTFNESGGGNLVQKPSSNLEDYLQSHPKMRVLRDLVLIHFKGCAAENKNTKIMIFSQYRDSVQEIGNMLNLLHPGTIKPMVFMGQAKTAGAGGRGLKQKEQIQVVEKFKTGGFNVLIATSVGEEGLDIGEVDLIICFDSNKSPSRNVQRMGRTGRQRQGNIIFLLTAGKEERLYRSSISLQSSISRNITDPEKLLPFLFKVSPRMVPVDLEPECFKMNIILSSEQESYSNKRRFNSEDEETEKFPDDSDFIPSAKNIRKNNKKAKVVLPKKIGSSVSKLSGKKSSSSTSQKHGDVQTLAQCLESMESRRAKNINSKKVHGNSSRVETITIDDCDVVLDDNNVAFDNALDSPPVVEYHNFIDMDDDYEFLCDLFDVKEMTEHSVAPPCIQIPLCDNLKISWKKDYSTLPIDEILLKGTDLQCLHEKVDSCVYVSSLKKYCKCGNVNGVLDVLLDDDEFNDADTGYFRDDVESNFDFGTPGLNRKEDSILTSDSKKTPLAEIQPVAQLTLPSPTKHLFPSPRFVFQKDSSVKCLSPVWIPNSSNLVGAKTSTPISYQCQKNQTLKNWTNGRDAVQGTSKHWTNGNSSAKTQNGNSFAAGFMIDENDPIFDDEWDTEMDLSSSNSLHLDTQNNARIGTINSNTCAVTVSAPSVNKQLCSSVVKTGVDVVLCSDDSSTASESELDSMLLEMTQSEQRKPKFKFALKSRNDLPTTKDRPEHLHKRIRSEFVQHRTPTDVVTRTIVEKNSQLTQNALISKSMNVGQENNQVLKSKSNENSSSRSSVEVSKVSPELGTKKKFVFKKRTSANAEISPTIQSQDVNLKQREKSCVETKVSGSTSRQSALASRDDLESSGKNISCASEPSKIIAEKRRENPHEIYSRIYDDDVDCIPGTSSDEEESSNLNQNCNNTLLTSMDIIKDANDDTDFDSDETRWDPNERIPGSPSPVPQSDVQTNKTRTTSSKEIVDSVFSPPMQTFKLSSYRKSSSQAVPPKVSRLLNFLPEVERLESLISIPAKDPSSKKLHAVSLPELPLQPQKPAVNPLRILPSRRIKLPDNPTLESFSSPAIQPNESQSKCTETSNILSNNVTSEYISQRSFKFQALRWSSPSLKPTAPSFNMAVNTSISPAVQKFKFKSSTSKLPTNTEQSHPVSLTIPSSRMRPIVISSPEDSTTLNQTPTEEDEDLLLLRSFQSPNVTSSTPNRRTILLSPGSSPPGDVDSPEVAFVRRSNNVKKRIIHSDERQPTQRSPVRTSKRRVRRNPFVLDEADDTSDESSVEGDWKERVGNYGDDGDSFVVQHDEDEDENASQGVSSSQQQAMYLRSVKDVVPIRAGRIENPLHSPDKYGSGYYDETEYDSNDSFCTAEVEYADVGVYTQCMIAAREQVDNENKRGTESKRRLRSRR